MKRIMFAFIAGAFVFTVSGADFVWAKGHVPLGQVQVCTPGGVAKNVSLRGLARALRNGGCRLHACDGDNIVAPGDPCDTTDGNSNGFCDNHGDGVATASTVGVTAACTAPPAP